MRDLPWKHLTEILRLAERDLDASRAFLARLISIRDALLASSATATTGLLALTFSSQQALVAFCGAAFVLVLSLMEAFNHITFMRVRATARSLESTVDAYVSALREQGAAAARSKSQLLGRLDSYTFGVERSLRRPTPADVRKATIGRARWWVFALLIASLLVGGGLNLGRRAAPSPTCVLVAPGTTVVLASRPEVKAGSLTLVACRP